MDDVEREVNALRELVASDGWRLVLRYANEQWNTSRVLDDLEASTRGAEADRYATVRLLAGRSAVSDVLGQPGRRIAELEAKLIDRDTPKPRIGPRA